MSPRNHAPLLFTALQVRALRGELDPKPWEENSERAPGVLLQSLVTFPSNYTFQVVGASEGGCPAGVHAEFVDDMVATGEGVARDLVWGHGGVWRWLMLVRKVFG